MSELDQDLLLFVAAHEVVLPVQAAGLQRVTEADATDRLDCLRAQRLVTRVKLSSQLPAAYRITTNGAEQVDSALPPLQALNFAGYRHQIAIAWLWAAGQRGRLGKLSAVLTRRQMQAAGTTQRTESLLNTPGTTFTAQTSRGRADPWHTYPDLALIQATGGWVTLDVILTPPTPEQLHAMLTRHQHDPLMLAQLYLVQDDQQIDQTITTAAQQLGIADRVHVQRLAENGIAGA